MDHVEINKNEIPYRYDLDLGEETFTLEFYYNETGDFFSVNLYKRDEAGNDAPLVMGEKLVLDVPLWSDIADLEMPAPSLIPLDTSGNETRISWESMGKTIFLFIDDEDPENEVISIE